MTEFQRLRQIFEKSELFEKKNNVFVKKDSKNYSKNFEIQWNEFSLTQFDSNTGLPLTKERFLESTEWKFKELKNKLVIELGSGAGRFTEILLKAESFIVSVEMSDAVYVNAKNNKSDKIIFVKSSLDELNFLKNFFDYVFCYGVAQHTPNILETYNCLYAFGKTDSKISVDHYIKLKFPTTKTLWRPLTKRINPWLLLKIIKFYIPIYFPIDTFIKTKIPNIISKLIRIILPIPCLNYTNKKNIPQEKHKLIEWAIMDTFDALGAKYDKPLYFHELEEIAKKIGLKNYSIKTRSGFLILNGVKNKTN